jgi:hypothetical protein
MVYVLGIVCIRVCIEREELCEEPTCEVIVTCEHGQSKYDLVIDVVLVLYVVEEVRVVYWQPAHVQQILIASDIFEYIGLEDFNAMDTLFQLPFEIDCLEKSTIACHLNVLFFFVGQRISKVF